MLPPAPVLRPASPVSRVAPGRAATAVAAALSLFLAAALGSEAALSPSAGNDSRGKQLYLSYCATCHGATGRGDGPAATIMARGFGHQPRNLTDNAHFARRTDAQLAEAIKRAGGPARHGARSPMPQWAQSKLTKQDIADLVAYIRVLHRPPRITGEPEAGRKLFTKFCAACHGPGGRGDGPVTRAPRGIKPRNFADRQAMGRRSDRDLFNAIKLGGPAVGQSEWMPAWSGAFTDQEIGHLVIYIRSLAPPHGK